MMLFQTQVNAVVLLLVGGALSSDLATKIFMGPRAKINGDPYSVYIGYNGTQVVCGGDLVYKNLVLTLASCVRERDINLITVTAGHRKLFKKNEGETESKVEAFKAISDNTNSTSDIVGLLLETTVDPSSPGIALIDVSAMEVMPNDTCVLSAYGNRGKGKPFKQSLNVEILDGVDDCDGFVSGVSRCYEPSKLGHRGRKRICEGDQGSPIVCEKNGEMVLVGVNMASSCEGSRFAVRHVDLSVVSYFDLA